MNSGPLNRRSLGELEQRLQIVGLKLRRMPVSVWCNLVIAFALIWLCRSFATLFWLLMPEPTLPQPQTLVAAVVDNGSLGMARKVDLASLTEADLFGKGVVAPVEVVKPVVVEPSIEDEAKETKLNLKLTGVLVSNLAADSTAIIAKGSDQKVYQIDDKLPEGNNVVLAKILSDRVILSNNGKFEALWLFSDEDFKSSSRSSSRRSSQPSASSRQEPYVPSRDTQQQISTSIKKSQVPQSISDVVRFSVHRENGQMVGYRIRPGKDRELFDQLGLRANDIVTAVNGVPIDDPQKIRENYQQLKSATSADLEVRREDEVLAINISLDTGE